MHNKCNLNCYSIPTVTQSTPSNYNPFEIAGAALVTCKPYQSH